MKKFIVLFTLLVVFSAMFVGCKKTTTSNDDDNNNGINPGDYSFYMGIMKTPDWKSGYSIIFDSENDSINSIELKINNETVEVTHESYEGYYDEWYVRDLNLVENTTYTFEVKINESKSVSNFSLKTPDLIEGNWPDNLNLTEPITFNWTMAHDAMHQEFSADAYKTDTDEDADKYEVLKPSDRSYTMPANWMPSDYDEYNFSVINANYHTDNHLLALAMSYYGESYGYGEKDTNPVKKAQTLMRKVAKSIK